METQQPHAMLARRIGLGTAVAVVVGSTIGSGIFRTPASVAGELPGPMPMLLCWIVGGLIALCGALTLAEVGGAHPETGGPYAFIRDAYGRAPAFLFGWAQLLIIRPASLAAVAMAFSEYALRSTGYHVRGENDLLPHFLASGALLLVSGLNYIGVRFGGGVQNITTILKCTGLAAIIVMALGIGLPASGGGYFTRGMGIGEISLTPFALALISVLWAYDGWGDVSYVAGEVVEPRRNVPRALVWGTLLIIALYALANIAYLSVLPILGIKASPLVAADVAEILMGPAGVLFVSVTVMVSTFGTLNGSMLTSPRIFFAMADDGLFFKPVARVNERFGTPGVATWLACGLGIAFIFGARKFENLADIFVTGMIPFYALAVGSVFFLRKQKGYDPPVRVPLYPLMPILFIVAMGLILFGALRDQEQRNWTLAVFGGILAGLPVYYATVGRPASVAS